MAPNDKISDYSMGLKAMLQLEKFWKNSDNKVTWQTEMEWTLVVD